MKSTHTWTTLIQSNELAAVLGTPGLIPVDCRFSFADSEAGRSAYASGHIPSAVYAHLDDDLSGPIVPGESGRHPLPTVTVFSSTLSTWGISKDCQVVAYDDSGGAIASRLWWMLNWVGHRKVAVLDGGWTAWKRNGFPVSIDLPQREKSIFVASIDPSMLVSTSEVVHGMAAGNLLLVDARDQERFRGSHEPIDPVAGHIPGALSLPFKENLTESGKFAARDVLRDRFVHLFAPDDDRPVVCYCGSGVTAAHNILAMRHAGLGNARLYAGSWSEWILDGERPVAKTAQ